MKNDRTVNISLCSARRDSALRSGIERFALIARDIRRRGILYMVRKEVEHIRLRVRARLAKAIRLELVPQEPLNLCVQRLRWLKLWPLQNLSRSFDSFSVIARFQRDDATPFTILPNQ